MFRHHLRPFLNRLPENFLPFLIGGKRYGAVRNDLADRLRRWPEVFHHTRTALRLREELDSPEARSEALAPVVETLHREGVIPTWVGELFPLVRNLGEPPAALIERAAVHLFGSRAFGVHVNGLVREGEQISVWLARRSPENPLWPGKLDQLVAGGVAFGYSPEETLLKEAEEEASVPAELARRAVLVSELSYLQPLPWGLEYGTLLIYDLWLPDEFEPHNRDGEVAGFERISLAELAERLKRADLFKPNVALVCLDLLLRFGTIPPDHPEHPLLRRQLYRDVELD